MRLFGYLAFAGLDCGVAVADDRPELLFREDWTETPTETPITQAHVANDGLVLHLHGPGRDVIRKSHHDTPADDPYYVWSGLCEGNWAVSLERREGPFDLTGLAKVRWRSKQAGFRALRIVVKLAGGGWIVAGEADPPSKDWRIREFNMSDQKWRRLNIEMIVEGEALETVDLSRVEQIGFTDLMRGGRSIACSRLDWIEVYARPKE